MNNGLSALLRHVYLMGLKHPQVAHSCLEWQNRMAYLQYDFIAGHIILHRLDGTGQVSLLMSRTPASVEELLCCFDEMYGLLEQPERVEAADWE